MRRLGLGDGVIGRGSARWAVLVAVVGLMLAPPAALAQTVGEIPYIDAVDAWADGQSVHRLLPGSGQGTGTEPSRPNGPARPKKPTARQLKTLRFERSRAVTGRAYEAVMELLEPGYDPAALTAEFDRLKALVHAGMRDLAGRWSPNDIGDVSAYMLLNSYGAYHARTSLPDAGMEAVRRAARRRLASNARVRRLSDARKQTAAEMLELRTILRISELNLSRTERDAARERAARAGLRSWMRAVFGVDLEKVKLTRRGLVRRPG